MFDELRRLAERADLLAVDCNLSWALQSRIADRTAVLVQQRSARKRVRGRADVGG
jgi:hypothetical protein